MINKLIFLFLLFSIVEASANIKEKIIQNLKKDYEDYWKNSNLINTSLKLPLTIKVKSEDKQKILKFEFSIPSTISSKLSKFPIEYSEIKFSISSLSNLVKTAIFYTFSFCGTLKNTSSF